MKINEKPYKEMYIRSDLLEVPRSTYCKYTNEPSIRTAESIGMHFDCDYPDEANGITEHVKFRTLPEVTVASCTYQGSYTQITDVYTAVIAWMEANGCEPAEPMFNIYHVSPHETQNPDEFVTEICYPVKKK